MTTKRRPASWLRKCGHSVLALALLNLFVAPPAAASDAKRAASYDGETLFRGLFFGAGDTATLFPEIWRDPGYAKTVAQLRAESGVADYERSTHDSLVEQMRAADASVFSRFKAGVTSGDPLAVDASLKDAGEALIEACVAKFGEPPSFGGGASPTPEAIFFALALVVTVAAVVHAGVVIYSWVAAAVFVAVAAALVKVVPRNRHVPKGTPEGSHVSRLEYEMWVDSVAQRLGPEPIPTAK
jgi:SdpC family antimicrobial peptide